MRVQASLGEEPAGNGPVPNYDVAKETKGMAKAVVQASRTVCGHFRRDRMNSWANAKPGWTTDGHGSSDVADRRDHTCITSH